MSIDFDARYQFLCSFIHSAGELAWSYYQKLNSLTVETKGAQDLVSEADKKVELFIKKEISAQFPEDSFLGEETKYQAGTNTEICWIIDPIDGTLPFLSKIPQWCISIACVYNRKVIFGAVFEPQTQDLYHAFLEKGAFLNDQQILLKRATFQQGMVGCGYALRSPTKYFTEFCHNLLQAGGMVYKSGSGALMICYAAAGKLVAFAEAHIHSWDAAAGYIIAKEAGLWVNDFTAGDWMTKGNPIVVCPEELKAELIAMIPWKEKIR